MANSVFVNPNAIGSTVPSLTVTGDLAVGGTATIASLTSGRVVLAGTGGLLEDDVGLTYNKATDTLFLGTSYIKNLEMGVNGIVYANSLRLDYNAPDVILQRGAAYNAQFRNGTNANRLDVANTWSSATNNEMFSVDWQTTANVLVVGSRTAATGTGRTALFIAQSSSGGQSYGMTVAAGNATVSLGPVSVAGAAGTLASASIIGAVILAPHTNTATTGANIAASVSPTYNQASGDASNTDFRINRTQTAVGSGAQLLLDAQVSTVSKFKVDNVGLITSASPVLHATSAALTDGAAAQAGTLLNAPTAGNPAKWISIVDNGTTRWIPTWV